jgi:hypothetical protein
VIVDRPVVQEKIIEKPVYIDKIIEKEVIVDRPVEVVRDRVVEKVVEVENVDKIRELE